MVQWTYVHTGGLNITGLSAVFSYVDGTSAVMEPVAISSLDTTSVNVSGLVTGFEYTFNITAENSNGSSTISCRPTPHIVGENFVNSIGNVSLNLHNNYNFHNSHWHAHM